MIQPLIMLAAVSLAALISNEMLGYELAYEIGYGVFTLMAAMISATFLWLWMRRATPLAIGMFFGWAGASGVLGWLWVYRLLEHPSWMVKNPLLFIFLSVYFVGAMLHFEVIGRSFGLDERVYYLPVALCAVATLAAHFFI